MASTRVVRALAAVASAPLALGVLGGVAHADALASDGSNGAIVSNTGGGVGSVNNGNSATTQQTAIGEGASNKSNTAGVQGNGPIDVYQSNDDYAFLVFDIG